MEIFGELAGVLRSGGGGGRGMCYLVGCVLGVLFGREKMEGVEEIRGDLGVGDIIDGVDSGSNDQDEGDEDEDEQEEVIRCSSFLVFQSY